MNSPLGLQSLQLATQDMSVYANRRARLLASMDMDSIALLPTAHEQVRNRDADFKFRADSSFYYLTGFAEPEAVLCLEKNTLLRNAPDQPFTLFCRERDALKEIWNGRRAGTAGAVTTYKADQAFDIQEFDTIMLQRLVGKRKIYVRLGQDAAFDAKVCTWIKTLAAQQRSGVQTPVEIVLLDPLIDDMRLFKEPYEITRMRQAAQISAAAHIRAMQTVRPNMMEYALEAELCYVFAKHGCGLAYNSIVGGGDNACILHYTENNAPLRAGDLVLIDAGAELDHYAADITRTFPVNGTFSAAQRALYQLVLEAQLAAIDAVRVGAAWDAPHEVALGVLINGLLALGLLTGTLASVLEDGSYKAFYMHRTSHWLGMDVHDVGNYRDSSDSQQARQLEAGMVLTIEPGLYVAPDNMAVDAKWRGIGIRIEDDVLVTDAGADVLSRDVPKSIADIEALMATANREA